MFDDIFLNRCCLALSIAERCELVHIDAPLPTTLNISNVSFTSRCCGTDEELASREVEPCDTLFRTERHDEHGSNSRVAARAMQRLSADNLITYLLLRDRSQFLDRDHVFVSTHSLLRFDECRD